MAQIPQARWAARLAHGEVIHDEISAEDLTAEREPSSHCGATICGHLRHLWIRNYCLIKVSPGSDAALRSAAPSPAPTACRSGFNTRVLDNGASLEEVQRAAGHADATTTKLCDRRGYNPEQSASFFASY